MCLVMNKKKPMRYGNLKFFWYRRKFICIFLFPYRLSWSYKPMVTNGHQWSLHWYCYPNNDTVSSYDCIIDIGILSDKRVVPNKQRTVLQQHDAIYYFLLPDKHPFTSVYFNMFKSRMNNIMKQKKDNPHP